ncbi:hypothetical protein [Actinomadura sp. 6N118]|uniref:hypothetical protein n=1 Tax=Actinomadura sp. 6N118 TaxID=3375151 RepID=UPI00379DA4B8
MDEDDGTVDPVPWLTELLQSPRAMAGHHVIGYEGQARREEWLAAAERVAEIIGCPVEVIDSGLFDDGFGHLKIKRSDAGDRSVVGRGPIPPAVVDAYEQAHRDDADERNQ